MTELLLLKILTSREHYQRYSRFIKPHVIDNKFATIFKDFGEYFNSNPEVNEISLEHFQMWFFVIQHPVIQPEKREVYEKILNNIWEIDEDYQIDQIIKEFTKREKFGEIADIAMQVAEGDSGKDSDDIRRVLADYEATVDKINITEKLEVTTGIVELIESQSVQTGLSWRLNELNLSIGPVSHHLIIFGSRPDSGKTSWIASEASFMAGQLKDTDKRVIVLNNEEQGDVVKHRIVQSALGKTNQQLLADPVHCLHEIKQLWGEANRVKVFDNVYDLVTANQILEQENPGLIVVDQLWNMQGLSKRSDNEVTRITLLYKEARKWGKIYKCPVLVVHQLDGSAGGMLYPNMEQFYLSKTALQGDGDVIITLGKSYDPMDSQEKRGLHIVKNKLGKHPACVRELKHGKMEIKIQPDIGRFQGDL